MPVTFEKDKDGRVVRQGNYNPVTPVPASGGGKKKGGGNPFANMVKSLQQKAKWVENAARYEQKRFAKDPIKRVGEIVKPAVKAATNDLRYEVKQLSNPKTAASRATRLAVNALGSPATSLAAAKGEPLATGAAADVVRNGVERYQKWANGGKRSDYTLNPIGRAADEAETTAFTKYGITPRQEQEGLQRLSTEFGVNAMTGTALAVGGAALTGAVAGVPVLGTAAARFANLLNPTAAKTFMGALTRTAAAGAVEEAVTTPFVDNTGGSAVSLMNMLLGTEFADPVQPEMDRIEAMGAALGPNTAAGAFIPAALAALPLHGAFRSIRRAKQAEAEVRPIQEARVALETAGVTETDPTTGGTRFTEGALTQPKPEKPAEPPANYKEAKEQMLGQPTEAAPAPETPKPEAQQAVSDPWTDTAPPEPFPGSPWPESKAPGSAPEPDPWKAEAPVGKPLEPDPDADPFDVDYDPTTTFEADVVLKELRELSYEDVMELYLLDPADSLTLNLESLAAARTPTRYDARVNWDNVSAPRSSIAERWIEQKYGTLLSAQAPESLRALIANSPELAGRAAAITGKTVEELTKADMVRAIGEHPDRVLLPGRLDNAFEPTLDIFVKPDEYQFKQNVDAAGVQAGNSLSGVRKWDPDAEGVLEVRRVPDTGELDMVNGHNRLDKAKELGIPTVPVKYMRTETAAQAREMGAISNISSGGGTVWDAAKFLKENPELDTLAKLKADGKPDKSGFWRDGLALSKLPPDLFKAAQDGVIDSKYAVLIGNSGLPEEKMGVLFRKAASKPSMDSMVAYIDIARASGGGGTQIDLFGNATEDLTDQLAQLYGALQAAIGDDKGLFGRVSRGAEKLRKRTSTEVNVKGAIAISEEAKAAQRFVKDMWTTHPELTQAMREGAQAIKGGASVASVVEQIKQEIPTMIDVAMGRAQRAEPKPITGDGGAAQAGFDFTSEAQTEVRPESPETPEFKATPEQVQRWENWNTQKQDQAAMLANKELLSETQLKNRKAKAADVQEREARTAEYIDEMPGSKSEKELTQAEFDAKWGTDEATHPQLPSKAEYKPLKELATHQAAIEYLDWYDNRIGKRQPEVGEKEAMELELVRRGIANGELRPPDVEIPPIAVTDADVSKAAQELLDGNPGEALLRATEEEERLRALYQEQDAEVNGAMVKAAREAEGFYDQPLKDQLPDQLNEIAPIESTSIADSLQAVNEALLESDRRVFRRVGQAMDKIKAATDELAEAETAPPPRQFTLPPSLARSSPRYGGATLRFESDLDKAAYILASDARTKSSKAAPKFRAALQEAGFNVPVIANYGDSVRQWVKDIAKETFGDASASSAKGELFVPASKGPGQEGGDLNLSRSGPPRDVYELSDLPPGHPERIAYIKTAVKLEKGKELLNELLAWDAVGGEKAIQKLMAQHLPDIQEAVSEGIRVSGIDPERFRLVQDVSLTKLTTPDRALKSQEAWWGPGSDYAELVRAEPSAPESLLALDSQLEGVHTPQNPAFAPGVQDTILISLRQIVQDVLQEAGEKKPDLAKLRQSIYGLAYHESFHRLQARALTAPERLALATPEAKKRMQQIIKRNGGTWSESMMTPQGAMELEAEAFGTWARMKRTGWDTANPVDKAFMKIQELVKAVKRKINHLRGKSDALSYLDVFELAYKGEIGKRSPSELNKLSKAMDPDFVSLMPDLAQNVREHIRTRRAQTLETFSRLKKDIESGGCI